MKKPGVILVILAGIGLFDAAYLTYEHFFDTIAPCTTNIIFADCGKVLNSEYASIMGIPVALAGVVYYLTVLSLLIFILRKKSQLSLKLLFKVTLVGFMISVYFVILQLFVIQSICFYCMISALLSTCLFFITTYLNRKSFSIN